MGIGEDKKITVQFDPAYANNSHIRIIDDVLSVAYKEHPHVVSKDIIYFTRARAWNILNQDYMKT